MEPSKNKLTTAAIAAELGVSKTTVSRALSGKGRISPETRERVEEYVRQAGYTAIGSINKVDGVILSRTLLDDPCLDLVRQRGVPFVAMGRLRSPAALQVDHDHVGAARELTRLLLQMGLRQIAYLGNREAYTVNMDRLEGYRQALEESGLAVDPGIVFSNVNSDEGRVDALEAALEQKPECLLCGDDNLAFEIMKDLQQRGISVPGQLKLASLYDSEILQNNSPTVTAVQFDAAALGTAACRLLLDAMAGKEVVPRQLQGYQVILRESTK